MIHDRELIIPYAMSDYASTFATVSLELSWRRWFGGKRQEG